MKTWKEIVQPLTSDMSDSLIWITDTQGMQQYQCFQQVSNCDICLALSPGCNLLNSSDARLTPVSQYLSDMPVFCLIDSTHCIFKIFNVCYSLQTRFITRHFGLCNFIFLSYRMVLHCNHLLLYDTR